VAVTTNSRARTASKPSRLCRRAEVAKTS
jgi:hypothetical protein